MRSMLHHTVCLTGLTAALAASAALADFTIDHIIPENAVVVVGVHNVEKSLERFRSTPMHKLLNAPEFEDIRKEMKDEFLEGWEEFLMDMGVDRDVRPWPTGVAGMGMYPVIDPERGTPILAMIAFAQFGEQAEGVAELVRKGIAKAEEDRRMEYEQLDILGRTVHVLDFGAVIDAIEEEFEDDPFGMFMMMPDFSQLLDSFQRMYLLREQDGFILGTDLGSLTESLERMDRGEAGLGRRDEYRRVLDQLGTNDAFGMILTRDLVRMISGIDQTGMMMMAGPMAAGIFGEMRGIGTSVRLDSPNAMLEQRFSVYMPHGKRGLSRLFDVKAPREDLPRFVGPDSTMYVSMNFAFDRVADVIRDIINSNPMIQMGVGDGFNQVEPVVREMTATLGPRVYITSALQRPIELGSNTTLFAIECKNEQAYENIFAQFAPGLGLQPRDFLGHRIYSMDDQMDMMAMMTGMDLPSTVGIGGGYVFFGTTPSVEQALRIISQQDRLPSLADEPGYRRAVAALPQRQLLSWQYVDIVTVMEGSMSMVDLQQKQMRERMQRDFPEMAAEWGGQFGHDFGADKIDWELIRRHIGPSVSYIEPTDQGFIGVTYYLAADPEDQ